MYKTLITGMKALAVILGCATQCFGVDGWESVRAAAVTRIRPIIYDTDGDDMLLYPDDKTATVENFTALRLRHVLGTKAKTVSYCPECSGFCHMTTRKAGEAMTNSIPTIPGTRNAMMEFAALNTDALEMASDFCRTNGLELFVSFRVNDMHDAETRPDKPSPFLPRFKMDHPEFMMGSVDGVRNMDLFSGCGWSCVDFSHRAVREHMKECVRKLVENYAVDGIEYDFNRHGVLFRSVATGGVASDGELESFTCLMRDLKDITEAAGRRRNRPIVIAVRTPDSEGYARAIGIDLKRWFEEKLVDVWIGAGYFQLNHWNDSVAFAHKHGIVFYASLDESRIERHAKVNGLPFIPGRMTRAHYAARYAAAMASGCDGVYLFNLEGAMLHEMASMDPRDVSCEEKFYFAADRGSGGYLPNMWLKDGERFNNMPRIDPGGCCFDSPSRALRPRVLKPGETCRFRICLGDDFAGAVPPRRVTATVLCGLKEGGRVALSANGRDFAASVGKNGMAVILLPSDFLRKCLNDIAVTFPESTSATTFNDFMISVTP